MKKTLAVLLFVLFVASPAFAGMSPSGGGGGYDIVTTDCSGFINEGFSCWDSDDDVAYTGDGTTAQAIGPGTPGAGDIETVGNCTSGACFVTGSTSTTLSSDTDLIFNLDANNNGANESLQINSGASVLVFDVDETGLIRTLVGLDAIGAVDMDYGSADVTDHTFITDSTGTAEIVLPAGAIDSTEILDATLLAADFATGAVTTTVVLDATIAQVDIDDTQTIAADPANGDSSVWFGTTGLIWEGATSDTNEMLLVSADIGQDSTITIPDPGDAADTVVLVDTAQTLTNKTIDATNTVTINASDITDLSANSDITADLEEEGQVNATVVTGNAAALNDVLLATGANAAGWDATPAIDCTDCTNIPAAADLNDVTNVTLTTPGDGAVLCFTGTANASVDCTVGGDATATEDTGTLTLTVVDVTCSGSCIGDAEVDNNITVDLATLATTLTITDNEATAETNAVLFTSAGDLDGGNLGIESDGDFTYTPSTGTVAATTFSGAFSGNATTATTATVATTVTITDNEATAENNAVIFTSGGDLDGGDIGLESDGDLFYTPSTGTLTTTTFAGALSGNATTATALAANPGDCSANEFANAIASNGDLTCAAIVDADVPDTITVSNYLLLAGGTLTGEVIVDNLGLEFTAGDDHTDCTAFAATGGGIFYDDSEGLFKKCQDNVLSDLDTSGAIRLDEIANPTAASTITSDDTETVTFDSASDGETYFTISLNTADLLTNTTALLITAVDNDDANYLPLTIQDDQDGTPDNLFTVDSDGDVLLAGNLTVGDNLAASMTITGDNSGAVDPVITLSDGVVDVSTGELREGGFAVLTAESASFASSVLLTALTNPTGTGVAVFGTSPTIATPTLTGQITATTGADDDSCVGDQGKFWFDDTDARFEFCNANTGTPDTLGGDVTGVGNCASGACFVTGGTGTTIESDTGLIMALDADNNGTETFTITDGADATVFTVTEAGAVTSIGSMTATSFVSSAIATPAIDFDDSDDAGTIEGSINVNCPTANDCDMDFAVNSGADTETVVMKLDTTDAGATTLQIGTPGTNYINVTEGGVMTSMGTGSINMSDASDVVDLETISVTGVADAQIFVGDGAASGAFVTVSGDATLANTGALTIAAAAVEESMLAASLAFSDGDLLDLSAVSITGTAEGLILPQHATDCSTTGTAEGQVCWEADANVLYVGNGATVTQVGGAEVNNLETAVPPTVADTEIFIGTGAGTGAFAVISGDATLANNGALTIANGAVEENMLAATLTFDDGDLLDFGTFVTSATEGLLLPANATTCASATAEAQVCWEEDANVLWIGDGAAAVQIGGITAFDAIGDPSGDGSVAMAELDQDFAWNTAAAAAVFDGLTLSLVYDGTSDAGEQNLLRVVQLDGGGDATGTPDALILLENLDTTADDGVAAGLEIRATTSGAMPVAIDVSDPEITTAIDIGANDIVFSTGTLVAADLEIIDSGDIDLAAEVTGTLPVANGGTGATTLTDGGVLLGSGTGAVTAMAVLADGAIVIGDGTTDPVALTAFTSSTGTLLHEQGGMEADVSAYGDGLYGIASGVTTDIDTEAELETALGGIDVLVSTETVTKSILLPAGAFSSDGTQCADPAEVTIGSWGKMFTVICTDNDASIMTVTIPAMPDGWDAGTITAELIYIQDAADTSALNADVAGRCVGDTETPAAYGTEVALDDAAVTGTDAKDSVTSAAVTLAGACAAGDMVQLQVAVDATGTTTAMATLNFVGLKIEYTWTQSGD